MTTNIKISSDSWIRRGWKLVACLALVAAFAATPLFTQKASAGVPCWDGYMCLYEHVDRGGAQFNDYWPTQGQCYGMQSGWDNRVSSIETKTWGVNYVFYALGSCNGSGFSFTVGGAQYYSSLPWYINDSISSYRRG